MSTAGVSIVDRRILLIVTDEDCSNAISEALRYAKLTSMPLHVMQILTSDLYHYGRHDLVATRPSKRQFLIYVRDEVLKAGKMAARVLQEAAERAGVSMEIQTVESEDILSAAADEAKEGYELIFVPKQEKKLFPLFNRTLAEHLRGEISSEIIAC